MENFNLEKINTLCLNDQKEYVKKYFVPLANGQHAVLFNGSFEIQDESQINKAFFNRMSKELKTWYFHAYLNVRYVDFNPLKLTFYDDKINFCQLLKADRILYKDFSESIKEKVQLFLSYILEVLCDNNLEAYTYLMSWIANMIQGRKNISAIILKTTCEGVGKTTLPTFLIDHVFKKKNCLQTSSQPFRSNFNFILGGKIFVNVEEMEASSKGDWEATSSRLKTAITSDKITLEQKGVDPFEATNISNFMITSNGDLKGMDGRRHCVLDVNTKYKGNVEYWNKLYSSCFNDEVGDAFFSYCCEMDLTKYEVSVLPMTKSKNSQYAIRLKPVARFLKEQFILKRKEIDAVMVDALYTDFKLFCADNNIQPFHKCKFCEELREFDVEYYKSSSYNKYTVSKEKLDEISKKFKWMHELDVYDDEKEEKPDEEEINKQNLLKDEIRRLTQHINSKDEQINKLTLQNIELQQQRNIVKEEPKKEEPKKEEPKEKQLTKNGMSKYVVSLFENMDENDDNYFNEFNEKMKSSKGLQYKNYFMSLMTERIENEDKFKHELFRLYKIDLELLKQHIKVKKVKPNEMDFEMVEDKKEIEEVKEVKKVKKVKEVKDKIIYKKKSIKIKNDNDKFDNMFNGECEEVVLEGFKSKFD